ncbi:SPS1, serine threonine protein kinase [Pyrenophora tritici-repentis]|nr:SPS1 Serine threonine protein kinase [Pyrenophora tritici-repentis]PZC88764.1 SPS1, Serine threonine protein kinase [Pyrenophora tritici-repentis]PZD30686.1 SPS1, serine threonine protein kinase [Pyrenophora tritici-repentis]
MSEALATFSDGTAVPMDGKFHVDPSRPQSSVKYLKPWHPPGVSQVLFGGNTARLALLPDGTILKYVHDRDDHWAIKGLDIEHHILTALGSHQRLVKYFGKHEYGLRFQFEVNGDIRRYFSKTDFKTIPIQQREKWVQQAAESIAFIHSKDVIHCDIHPNNFLLDGKLNLKLCDFAGSLFGELDGKAMESTPFFLPRDPLSTPNPKSDLFALGSVMYYIMAGREPYDGLSEDEITARFSRGEFPHVDEFECGQAISGCWTGKFNSAQEVVVSLSGEAAGEVSRTPTA